VHVTLLLPLFTLVGPLAAESKCQQRASVLILNKVSFEMQEFHKIDIELHMKYEVIIVPNILSI
jgi:hypothetical protein